MVLKKYTGLFYEVIHTQNLINISFVGYLYRISTHLTQHNIAYRTNAHINLGGCISYTYDINQSKETRSL